MAGHTPWSEIKRKRRDPVVVGSYTFHEIDYDEQVDILHLGEVAIGGGDTPEGHIWMYPDDTSDEVVGLVLMWPRWYLERDGEVTVTTPEGERVTVDISRFVMSAGGTPGQPTA